MDLIFFVNYEALRHFQELIIEGFNFIYFLRGMIDVYTRQILKYISICKYVTNEWIIHVCY